MSNVFDTWIFRAIFPFGTAVLCQRYPPSLLFPFLFGVSHAWASHRIPLLCVASRNTWSSEKESVFTWYITQPLCFLLWLLSRIYWLFSVFLTYVGICIFHPAFIIQTVVMQISSLRHLQRCLVCVFFEAHGKMPQALSFSLFVWNSSHHASVIIIITTTLRFRIFCSCFEFGNQ